MEDNILTFDLTGSGESEAFANLILGLNKNGIPYGFPSDIEIS